MEEEPKEEPSSKRYKAMALLMVPNSDILLTSLEELRSSAGLRTIVTTVARVPTMPRTMRSSRRVKAF